GGRKKAEAKPESPEMPAPPPPASLHEMPAPAHAPALEIAPAPVDVAPPPASALDVPVEGLLASSPFASGESIWKKEISFRRKAAEPQAPVVAAASGDELPAPPVSIWKKEISFRRKGDEEQPKS